MKSKKISVRTWPTMVGIKDQKWPACHLSGYILEKGNLLFSWVVTSEIPKYCPFEEKLQMLICVPYVWEGGGWRSLVLKKKGLPSYNKQHITPENRGGTSSMRNVSLFQ